MKLLATLLGNNSANLWAWGAEPSGSYGIGPVTKQWKSPNKIHLLKNNLVLVSNTHTFILLDNNVLLGSGSQSNGELGLGDTTTRYYFTVSPGSWAKICASVSWSLGLKTDGTLWHAGSKTVSKDGAGGTIGSNTSWTQIGTDTDWVGISIGYSTGMALKSNGTAYAWGENGTGQCAQNNTTTPVATPTVMSGGTSISKILMMGGGAAVIKTDGTLWTTGRGESSGQGATTLKVLTQLGSATYLDINSASFSTLDCVIALKTDNTAQIWGYSLTGCPIATYTSPQTFDSSNTYSKIVIARNQGGQCGILGLRLDGTIWGQGNFSVNGQGSTSGFTTSMQQIGADNDWIDVYGRFSTFFAKK